MIAYYWLQREEDIIGRLGWTHYRPDEVLDVMVGAQGLEPWTR
jgi:hypothetical protein